MCGFTDAHLSYWDYTLPYSLSKKVGRLSIPLFTQLLQSTACIRLRVILALNIYINIRMCDASSIFFSCSYALFLSVPSSSVPQSPASTVLSPLLLLFLVQLMSTFTKKKKKKKNEGVVQYMQSSVLCTHSTPRYFCRHCSAQFDIIFNIYLVSLDAPLNFSLALSYSMNSFIAVYPTLQHTYRRTRYSLMILS